MTISLPSPLVTVVDVPEVKNFNGNFVYNFFVADETVTENSVVPPEIAQAPAFDVLARYQSIVNLKVPRYISFQWANAATAAKNAFADQRQTITQDLIKNNLQNIVAEDQLSTFNYVSILFDDTDAPSTAYTAVSASLDSLTIDKNIDKNVTGYQLSQTLTQLLEGSFTNNDLVTAALSNFSKAATAVIDGKTQPNAYLDSLASFSLHTQINAALLQDIVSQSINDPLNQHKSRLYDLSAVASQFKQINNMTITVTNEEFKINVPILAADESTVAAQNVDPGSVVGYVIEKNEVSSNGKLIAHPPIIIDNPNATSAVDLNVRYGVTYSYVIKTIVLYKLVAFDKKTQKPAVISFLVSSKPSNKTNINCVETVAPPPPTDFKFIWNYEQNQLHLNWSLPINSQRDIKKFQVFRRASVSDCFELLKTFDFNDAATKIDTELQPSELTTTSTDPIFFYVDDDFDKQKSKYIYTVASIDAHGMVSSYGAQYEISFDLYKNKLIKKLISHSGAPRQYPNFYLENDVFSNVIKVSGPHAQRMTLYFDPICFTIKTDKNTQKNIVETKQTKNAKYRFSFLNLDNQTPASVDIVIDDRAKQT